LDGKKIVIKYKPECWELHFFLLFPFL
jgi:hypothetical protein